MLHAGAYRSLYFGLYDAGAVFMDTNQKFFWAQFVTFFSVAATYPLTVVRTRLIMQSGEATVQYSGTMDCVKKMIAQEGKKSLYKGLTISLARPVYILEGCWLFLLNSLI